MNLPKITSASIKCDGIATPGLFCCLVLIVSSDICFSATVEEIGLNPFSEIKYQGSILQKWSTIIDRQKVFTGRAYDWIAVCHSVTVLH